MSGRGWTNYATYCAVARIKEEKGHDFSTHNEFVDALLSGKEGLKNHCMKIIGNALISESANWDEILEHFTD